MFISIADSLVAKGERRGLARAVLGVLEHRSVSIPDPVRRRVFTSRDEPQLLRWLERAATATSVGDVFDDLDG